MDVILDAYRQSYEQNPTDELLEAAVKRCEIPVAQGLRQV
jgi:hypothetical protein